MKIKTKSDNTPFPLVHFHPAILLKQKEKLKTCRLSVGPNISLAPAALPIKSTVCKNN